MSSASASRATSPPTSAATKIDTTHPPTERGGAAVTLSGLAIAALCGVILNAVLPGNDYVFGVSVEGDKSADLGSY